MKSEISNPEPLKFKNDTFQDSQFKNLYISHQIPTWIGTIIFSERPWRFTIQSSLRILGLPSGLDELDWHEIRSAIGSFNGKVKIALMDFQELIVQMIVLKQNEFDWIVSKYWLIQDPRPK